MLTSCQTIFMTGEFTVGLTPNCISSKTTGMLLDSVRENPHFTISKVPLPMGVLDPI